VAGCYRLKTSIRDYRLAFWLRGACYQRANDAAERDEGTGKECSVQCLQLRE